MATTRIKFNQDFDALRGMLKSSGYEEDPYKIIIYIERFILKYGMKWTQETVSYLKARGQPKEQKLNVLFDIMQTQKTEQELLIFKIYNNGRP